MRALITGINGFIGTYLAKHLHDNGYEVSGTSREKNENNNFKVQQCDLVDYDTILKIIGDLKPDYIFHLAAQSNIPYSFKNPQETISANVTATINLLEALKISRSKSVFVSIGSSSEYGHSDNKILTENSFPKPSSPYAISKLAQGHFVELYRNSYGIKAVHVRPFAIIGPGKKNDAVSDFARGIVAIEKGQAKNLQVGNVSHSRDFLDVRDCVRALQLIAENPNFPSYNICSGKSLQLNEVLQKLTNLAKTKVKVETDPDKTRPADDPKIVGDAKRLFSTGFKQEYPIDETLLDTLNYWRKHD